MTVYSVFLLSTGTRFDFVLNADQSIGNFWLRVLGIGDCEGAKANGMAIVRYNQADFKEPDTDPAIDDNGIVSCL